MIQCLVHQEQLVQDSGSKVVQVWFIFFWQLGLLSPLLKNAAQEGGLTFWSCFLCCAVATAVPDSASIRGNQTIHVIISPYLPNFEYRCRFGELGSSLGKRQQHYHLLHVIWFLWMNYDSLFSAQRINSTTLECRTPPFTLPSPPEMQITLEIYAVVNSSYSPLFTKVSDFLVYGNVRQIQSFLSIMMLVCVSSLFSFDRLQKLFHELCCLYRSIQNSFKKAWMQILLQSVQSTMCLLWWTSSRLWSNKWHMSLYVTFRSLYWFLLVRNE